MKPTKLLLIHHAHTDIGYTARQERIMRDHYHYIQQVMTILDNEPKNPNVPFYWTCENYWQVRNFLDNATTAEQEKFEGYVKAGRIDVSLNYFNLTELVDNQALTKFIKEGHSFTQPLNPAINSAMSADINGYSWGFSESLINGGVDNLFSCIHTHHGMTPLFKKQTPFWWKSPTGKKILVWSGEHYQFGNELLCINGRRMSYGIKDEWLDRFESPAQSNAISLNRITRYFKDLETQEYPYSFVPAMISGSLTDNSAPNYDLTTVIDSFNQSQNEVEVQLITLNEFFRILREQKIEIPTYSGDWTDWWADGVGSTPAPTKLYKQAQRNYHQLIELNVPDDKLTNVEKNLMLYAEHTWGFASSVSEPWNTEVNELDYRKAEYATQANRLSSQLLDERLEDLGADSIRVNRPKYYKVINPKNAAISAPTKILLYYWENVDDQIIQEPNKQLTLINTKTGAEIPIQCQSVSNGMEIQFEVLLQPHEKLMVQLKYRQSTDTATAINYSFRGAEGVADLKPYSLASQHNDTHVINTTYFKIEFDDVKGISSLYDKVHHSELLCDNEYGSLFAGIYEKTPIENDNPCNTRSLMGRNRKGRVTDRFTSKLKDIKIISDGKLYIKAQLSYQLTGTELYQVILTIYKNQPRINAKVQIHKTSTWAPENLYVALPIKASQQAELYVDKQGCIIRPGIDQLPGTCTDFYLIQNGLVSTDDTKSVIVSIKDAPLIWLGDLNHHQIELCSNDTKGKNQEPVYSWLMNNFWETNFKVDLAGFYEFEYDITVQDTQSMDNMFKNCEAINEGVLAFPAKEIK